LNQSQGYVVLATFGFSFILVFSTLLKDTGVSSFEQLFFRLGFGFLILLFIMTLRRKLHFTRRKNVPFFAAIGLTYALFTLSGLSAIAFGTPIPVAVALVYTQPIFTAAISRLTRKEKVSAAKTAVILLSIVGALLVSDIPTANPQIHLGIVFPILAGFFYAVYLWLKRQATPLEEYTPYQVLFNTFMFAVPFLVLFWLVLRNFFNENPLFVGMITLDSYQLILLFLFALFSTVLPYGLLNYVKVEEVSPTTEGLLLLGDPLLHTIWGTLLFGQYISEMQYVGAALILVSAALNLKTGTKRVSKANYKTIGLQVGQLQGVSKHFGHLPLYFCKAAASKSTLTTFAKEANQARTSANSSRNAFSPPFFIASPNSPTSSTNQLNVPTAPRLESR